MVQAVLRGSPKALACSSSVRKPADSTASASSLILDACRAFTLKLSGSGRSPRLWRSAADNGRKPDELGSMKSFLWSAAEEGVVGTPVGCNYFCSINLTSNKFCFSITHAVAINRELMPRECVFGAAVCSGARKKYIELSIRCLAYRMVTVLEKSVFSLAWNRFRNEEQ